MVICLNTVCLYVYSSAYKNEGTGSKNRGHTAHAECLINKQRQDCLLVTYDYETQHRTVLQWMNEWTCYWLLCLRFSFSCLLRVSITSSISLFLASFSSFHCCIRLSHIAATSASTNLVSSSSRAFSSSICR